MAEVFKRPSLPVAREVKRARFDESAVVLSGPQHEENARTSNLMAPTMALTGHEGEIYGAQFSPDGTCLASAGYDMKIFFWNVFGECENFSVLSGHTGAIMDVHFNSDSTHLFTCATDKTVRVWDMETGECLRKFKSHTDFVNSCHPARRGPELVCSGGDDGFIIVHDLRKKDAVFKIEIQNNYQVTAITFNDTAEQIISGGIDNVLKVWDLRRNEIVYHMVGHSDTVTGLRLNPEGTHVLSNSMDCTARMWDIRPFASTQRCLKTFTGHQHNFEKNLLKCAWSHDGTKVSCGSSDRFTHVWDVSSKNLVYKLPGHQGSVNAVDFHPAQPILLSAGSDKRIFLSELAY